jgi:hypothetical protein
LPFHRTKDGLRFSIALCWPVAVSRTDFLSGTEIKVSILSLLRNCETAKVQYSSIIESLAKRVKATKHVRLRWQKEHLSYWHMSIQNDTY